ncbi:signal transduction histidine kinase [Microbacterium resistens]|uniref:histidine kinase n=1 Tax=Microbacterium resistens TaxID=156977 RepID=A0ABU1SE95_9MICO|nr:histidine kinase [Microbacterium resistens]MDR6867915.1 signal transduction histidine kinase [Microbacterium resistens]
MTEARVGRWKPARPLPGGWAIRALLLSFVGLMVAVDLPGRYIDLTSPLGWINLFVPYVPLIALLFGAFPAAVAWLATAVLLLCLGSQLYQLAQFLLPTAIVLAFVAFLMPWRSSLAFSAAAYLTIPIALLINPEVSQSALIEAAVYSMSIAVGVSLRIYQERNRRSIDEIKTLKERQAQIRREERTTLAHELHDIVAHDVTIIAMQAQRAGLVTEADKTQEILRSIGDSARQALNDLRSLVLLLKDEEAPEPIVGAAADDLLDTPEVSGETTTALGFFHDLKNVVEALERSGFEVDFAVRGEVARVPKSLRQALRRTIRELGSNVLKHATAGPVEVTLIISDPCVTIRVSNTYRRGRLPVASSRTGLEAMRARCEVFGGRIESGGNGERWTTEMSIPLDGVARSAEHTKATR